MEDGEPKPLVFLTKPVAAVHEPQPLDFSNFQRPEKVMAEPKGLNFGSPPPPAAKSAVEEPRGLKLPNNPAPPPAQDTSAPRALGLPPQAPPGTLPLHTVRGVIAHVPVQESPEDLLRRLRPVQPPAAPREAIIGGDPRAPALVEKAKAINPTLAIHRLFRNRLEMFLDLRPAQWATWADKDLTILINSASAQSEFARQLSLANAVKWATDCEQAYKKPPGLLDRLGPKPEFYKERLSQARDVLINVCDQIDHLVDDLKPRMETISLDALVLQVATADEQDASNQITATRRLQTITGGQQTAEMILLSLENLQKTIANQKATVSDLLTVTIPNWIIARSKA